MVVRGLIGTLVCSLAACDDPVLGTPDPEPGRWRTVDAGLFRTCALDGAGALWCWGVNWWGQLGDGTGFDRNAPVLIDPGPWNAVSVGQDFACGIKAPGAVWCWGGYPGSFNAFVPEEVDPGPDWTALSVGYRHFCALRADRSLWCAGAGDNGQVGDDTLIGGSELRRVALNASWSSVSAGYVHTCATTTAGELYCWGANYVGQLGIPRGDRQVPTRVGEDRTWIAVSAGGEHSCGLRSDGTGWCWGSNTHGQQGDGATTGGFQLSAVLTGPLSSIDAGDRHTCAVETTGDLWCWGANLAGAVGADLEIADVRTPASVVPALNWQAVSAGGAHTCALANNHLWCAGSDVVGQLGIGAGGSRTVPSQVPGSWRSVSAGATGSLAEALDGTIMRWGRWMHGVPWDYSPALSATPLTRSPVPVDVPRGRPAIGRAHACAIDPEGALRCWGANTGGQLGQGDITDRAMPVRVQDPDTWIEVDLYDHTCAIRTDQSLWCWGRMSDATAEQTVPAVIGTPGVDRWLRVTVDFDAVCAIRDDRTLWCWGAFGLPTAVGLSGVNDVALGAGRFCAVLDDGSLWCWQGPSAASRLPVPGTDWEAVTGGGEFLCARRAGGEVACWGANLYGQLGDGSRVDSNFPRPIAGDLRFEEIVAGTDHVCGTTQDRQLYCWGSNLHGQSGDGTAWRGTFHRVP